MLADCKKRLIFASAFSEATSIGAVVQLVRMPACHAGGREFESRRHRQQKGSFEFRLETFFVCINHEFIHKLFFLILRSNEFSSNLWFIYGNSC